MPRMRNSVTGVVVETSDQVAAGLPGQWQAEKKTKAAAKQSDSK